MEVQRFLRVIVLSVKLFVLHLIFSNGLEHFNGSKVLEFRLK